MKDNKEYHSFYLIHFVLFGFTIRIIIRSIFKLHCSDPTDYRNVGI